ncbi:hypothetical protein Tco_1506314 [Tanacetum coccineum]
MLSKTRVTRRYDVKIAPNDHNITRIHQIALSLISGSTQQCLKSGVARHLGVAGIKQHNGLVEETNVTLFAKVTIISDWIQDTYRYVGGFFGWLASIKQRMLEPVKVKCIFLGYREGMVGYQLWRLDDVTSKVVLYRNMAFNESGEYKETFIGSSVGTSSMQVLQGDEFKVEPPGDHTFEVEPQGNVGQKTGLKEEMNAQSYAYVLNNGCRKSSDDRNSYYSKYLPAKENVLGMEIFRDWSQNTLRVSQSMFYNEKLVQTLLEGHSILSLEGSLSGGCNVEKNGRYVVGVVEAKLQHMGVLSTTEATYMTLTKAVKDAIWLKRLSTKSEAKLRSVAGIVTSALMKAVFGSRFQHWY